MTLGQFGRLCKEVGLAFWKSNPARQAAALSFYSVCSFAPLGILAVRLMAWYSHDPASVTQLTEPLRELVGRQNAQTLEGVLRIMGDNVYSTRATVVGLLSLVFGASGVFVEVQAALNNIWQVIDTSWRAYFRQRMLTFLMVVSSGIVLFASLLVFTTLSVLSNYFASRVALPLDMIRLAHGIISFVLLSLLFTLIYQVLPDVEMHWGDVLLGAIVTSALFTLGKAAMGWYLARFGVSSVYGQASALVAIPFWLYYSTQIFLFGAHFTYVYACRYGSLAPPPGSDLPPAKPTPKRRRKGRRS